jgi:signal transduction histidine kinase
MAQDTQQLDSTSAAHPGQAPSSVEKVSAAAALPGADDLAEIIQAYNQVTDKLQQSHESLQAEVIRLRQELASADAQLQRSKRLSALGEMAAGIAHEIRNPLAAIQLYTSMITQDLQDHGDQFAEPLRCAREVASAVRGLDGIVGDVLSFAREDNPRPMLLPVADALDRVLAAHGPAIQAASVTVKKPYIDTPSLMMFADSEMLHRALLNLVRNAVDAMSLVPDRRELTLGVREDEVGVTLTVTDTGPGVDRDCVDRLFNPFFTTRATGTGLGLAIVHRIADAHGGSVSVADNPVCERGAIFELCLPAQSLTTTELADNLQPVGACA